MASVIGLMESARAYLPAFGPLKRRSRTTDRRVASVALPQTEIVAHVISDEVIPRLLAAHRHEAWEDGSGPPDHVTPGEAEAFAPLALELDAGELLDHVDAFVRRGVSIDTVFVELLAPAARQLGIMWEDDRCDFVDVTMGLWRLQEIVRELSVRIPEDHGDGSGQRRALFSVMPGDQHSFGTVVVADVFGRGGWQTECMTECATPDLLDRVARTSFDLIGLTVTHDDNIARLPSLIVALRSVSRNPRLCIMIGGRVPVEHPHIVTTSGADGTAPDAVQALDLAGRLVAALASRGVISA